MATAFLLPQDCLPASRSSHNASFSDIIPGASDSFQVSNALYQDQVRHKFNLNRRGVWTATSGSIPQPEPTGINTSAHKDVDGKKTEARSAEPRATIRNVGVFTILRRAKDEEVDSDVIKKLFAKVNDAESTTGHSNSKIEVKSESNHRSGSRSPPVEVKNGISSFKMRKMDRAVDGPKVQGSKVDAPKPQSLSTKVDWVISKDPKTERGKQHNGNLSPSKPTGVAKKSSHVKFDEVVSARGLNQMLTPKSIGGHKSLRTAGAAENFSWKLADAKQPAKVGNGDEEGCLAQLKRASTDPQIAKHLVTNHRSNVMEIPHSDRKSLGGIMRTSSTSCPERWAGPAYSSSPPPSSLPLPNFSLLNPKIPSSDCSPLLVNGSKRNSPQLPTSSPNRALPEMLLEGDSDVASATRSLRRMLKLEVF